MSHEYLSSVPISAKNHTPQRKQCVNGEPSPQLLLIPKHEHQWLRSNWRALFEKGCSCLAALFQNLQMPRTTIFYIVADSLTLKACHNQPSPR